MKKPKLITERRTKMDNMKFAEELVKLAKAHENDEVSIFDTPWAKICNAAARVIMDLDKELRAANEEIGEWNKWYESNEAIIMKAANKPTEVVMPVLKEEAKRPTFSNDGNGWVWDGIRRDIDDVPSDNQCKVHIKKEELND